MKRSDFTSSLRIRPYLNIVECPFFQEVCIELHVTRGSCVPVLLRVKP